MTHEPECFYTGERFEDDWYDPEDDPCICTQIQTAYRHGRIDAANAVEAELHAQDELNLEFNKRILSAASGEFE